MGIFTIRLALWARATNLLFTFWRETAKFTFGCHVRLSLCTLTRPFPWQGDTARRHPCH